MLSFPLLADDWSTTEAHLQYGNLATPTFAGGGDSKTLILTLQHASSWMYGDNFFFVDFLNGNDPNFNDNDIYAEFFANLSLNKMRRKEMWSGTLKDLGFLVGINWASQAKSRKYLPGIRLALDVPKFDFANVDITLYIDDSAGVMRGGAPAEDDSFMVDFNWALPFNIGRHEFSVEGHVEYIGQRENELGDTVKWWILGQPQFRYDLGKAVFDKPGQLFVGVELQFWINKLGDGDTNEFAPQALLVWRF